MKLKNLRKSVEDWEKEELLTLKMVPSRIPSDSGIEPSLNIITCSSSLLEDSSGIVSGKGAPLVPEPAGKASFSSYL